MRRNLNLTAVLLVTAFAAGCAQDAPTAVDASDSALFSNGKSDQTRTGMDQQLAAVRAATARFHSTTQALKAGYQPNTHCVAVPGLGGMGYHWVNPSLIDPFFEPLQPEAVLYAPDRNGNLKLVAVEYVVINTGQARPHFGGHAFDVNGVPPLQQAGIAHWSLHVWLWKDNPSGMFAPFNPKVSCTSEAAH